GTPVPHLARLARLQGRGRPVPFFEEKEMQYPNLTSRTRRRSIKPSPVIALAFLTLLLNAAAASAQVMSGGNFQNTSPAPAGGGGASTGSGNRVVEGTAGQTAAGGPYSNSTFTHDAGFWQTTSATVTATPSPTPTGTPPPNTIQFSAASYSVLEAMTATTVTVTRTGDTSGAATVDYTTIDGTATQRADFEYAAGHLSFAPGETARNIQLLINADDYIEGNESFSVVL